MRGAGIFRAAAGKVGRVAVRLAGVATLTLLALVAMPSPVGPDRPLAAATTQKRVALVIGNSAYRYTRRLDNPRNDAADIGVAAGASALSTNGLTSVNVNSVGGANDAILRMDAALTAVSGLRSTLGAIQNRFDSTINSLQAVSENLAASRSRIQDTDFAAETAALTRAQILQQAGTAMVAQANSVPQNVLSLLR